MQQEKERRKGENDSWEDTEVARIPSSPGDDHDPVSAASDDRWGDRSDDSLAQHDHSSDQRTSDSSGNHSSFDDFFTSQGDDPRYDSGVHSNDRTNGYGRRDGGSNDRQEGGYDRRDRGGCDRQDGGGYARRDRGVYDRRDRGGYDRRDGGGYDRQDGAGYDRTDRGGYDRRDEGNYDRRDRGGYDRREGRGYDRQDGAGNDRRERGGYDRRDGEGRDRRDGGYDRQDGCSYDRRDEGGYNRQGGGSSDKWERGRKLEPSSRPASMENRERDEQPRRTWNGDDRRMDGPHHRRERDRTARGRGETRRVQILQNSNRRTDRNQREKDSAPALAPAPKHPALDNYTPPVAPWLQEAKTSEAPAVSFAEIEKKQQEDKLVLQRAQQDRKVQARQRREAERLMRREHALLREQHAHVNQQRQREFNAGASATAKAGSGASSGSGGSAWGSGASSSSSAAKAWVMLGMHQQKHTKGGEGRGAKQPTGDVICGDAAWPSLPKTDKTPATGGILKLPPGHKNFSTSAKSVSAKTKKITEKDVQATQKPNEVAGSISLFDMLGLQTQHGQLKKGKRKGDRDVKGSSNTAAHQVAAKGTKKDAKAAAASNAEAALLRRGKQRMTPIKKKKTTLKKRILREREHRWYKDHPEDRPLDAVTPAQPTTVLLLLNMIELATQASYEERDEEYTALEAEVQKVCSAFGSVQQVTIPRPQSPTPPTSPSRAPPSSKLAAESEANEAGSSAAPLSADSVTMNNSTVPQIFDVIEPEVQLAISAREWTPNRQWSNSQSQFNVAAAEWKPQSSSSNGAPPPAPTENEKQWQASGSVLGSKPVAAVDGVRKKKLQKQNKKRRKKKVANEEQDRVKHLERQRLTGEGMVFVRFASPDECREALKALDRVIFYGPSNSQGRKIKATYYSEELYEDKQFFIPSFYLDMDAKGHLPSSVLMVTSSEKRVESIKKWITSLCAANGGVLSTQVVTLFVACEATTPSAASNVVMLTDLVDEEELEDDEEFEEVEADVRQMCEEHGDMQSLTIPRSGEGCVGLVFVHYSSSDAASRALTELSGKVISGRTVSAKFYPEHLYASQIYNATAALAQETAPALATTPSAASNVVMLTDLVDEEELEDDEEFEEVEADVRQMCEEHGDMQSLTIPRSGEGCVGLVFVHYSSSDAASRALTELSGKVISGRTVSAKFYPEHLYASQIYNATAALAQETAPALATTPSAASNVVMLTDLVDEEELEDDEEFEEVEADVRQMCEEHGDMQSLTIPRSGEGCVGLVFVHYSSSDAASRALTELSGKVISGRTVSAKFYPEHLYASQIYNATAALAQEITPVSNELFAKDPARFVTTTTQSYMLVQLNDESQARQAKVSLDGEEMDGHTVTIFWYPEDLYEQHIFEIPVGYEPDAWQYSTGMKEAPKPAAPKDKLKDKKKGKKNKGKNGPAAGADATSNTGQPEKKPQTNGGKQETRLAPVTLSGKEALEKVPKIPNARVIREYVNQPLNEDLDAMVTEMLQTLMHFQERARQKDPVKAKMRRRLVFGLREVKRGLRSRKIKCAIIAPNIDEGSSTGGLDDNVREIIDTAKESGALIVFALTRKRLGKALGKSIRVSVVGIQSLDGAHELWQKVESKASDLKACCGTTPDGIWDSGEPDDETK